MIYYIHDSFGLIRIVKSKTEAKYLTSIRPDWNIVAKKIIKPIFQFEDALI
jgi:flagellar motor switch protein FliG